MEENTQTKEVEIVKANGEREVFKPEKLRESLARSGADEEDIDAVARHIQKELHDGMSTQEIYTHAYAVLHDRTRPAAYRYSLRRAVMEMGPSGFPFEHFVGELLKSRGYKVEVGAMLTGACVEHEVDVLAEKDEKHIFVEAKYHNKGGIKSDLQVALYVNERYRDLLEFHEKRAERANREPRIHTAWLITNTKLTSQAVKYGECRGMRMIGWNYPKEGNLQHLILESGVHPVTALTTLSSKQKDELLRQDIVLCTALSDHKDVLHGLGLSDEDIEDVLAEARDICRLSNPDA